MDSREIIQKMALDRAIWGGHPNWINKRNTRRRVRRKPLRCDVEFYVDALNRYFEFSCPRNDADTSLPSLPQG